MNTFLERHQAANVTRVKKVSGVENAFTHLTLRSKPKIKASQTICEKKINHAILTTVHLVAESPEMTIKLMFKEKRDVISFSHQGGSKMATGEILNMLHFCKI